MAIKKKFIPLALIIGGLTSVQSIMGLTVEDFCDPKISSAKGIKAITPLSDGTSYSAISDDGERIEIYSYTTGKVSSVLFDINNIKGELKINNFDGYKLSANEKKILLWNDTKKIYRRSFTAQYYVYDILRGTLKKVSENGRQRDAVMSHDGRMVAYTRDNNIFISNLDYGTDYAVTEDGEKNKIINGSSDWSYEEEFSLVNTIRWSGDDNTLCFVKFDESDVPVYSFDNYKSYCDENPLSDVYPLEYQYKYPLAGYPNSKVSVYSYDLDTRISKKMDLSLEAQYVPSIEFSGDGVNLMVMVLNRDQDHLKLYRVNPKSTVSHLLLEEKSQAWLNPDSYQMVEYEKKSFLIGSERSGYRHLYEYDYNGNLLKQITKGDWNVTAYYGKEERTGKYYFQSTYSGSINRNLNAVDSKGGVSIIGYEKGTTIASFSSSMQYYISNYSNSELPNQYTICDNTGKRLVDLELNSAYSKIYSDAPRKEFITIKNDAGEDMNAYIIRPSNFDNTKKYPLLMYQYNGPDSQEVLNRWKMEGVYYIASQGYVVACVDGRGTGNRSREWAHVVYGHLGKYETLDQLSAVAALKEFPYIDSTNIGCFGWSYGGYMTLMELSATSTPFKVGVSMAPVTDWRFYDSIYTERYMKTPQQNEHGYDEASALLKTPTMNSRLLIMSGTNDDNVHYYNTLKYTSKLNFEGKVFDMMSYAGFEHSLPSCNARVMLFRKICDFLNTHLNR